MDKKRRNELRFYVENCESMGFTPAISSSEIRALIDGYERRGLLLFEAHASINIDPAGVKPRIHTEVEKNDD